MPPPPDNENFGLDPENDPPYVVYFVFPAVRGEASVQIATQFIYAASGQCGGSSSVSVLSSERLNPSAEVGGSAATEIATLYDAPLGAGITGVATATADDQSVLRLIAPEASGVSTVVCEPEKDIIIDGPAEIQGVGSTHPLDARLIQPVVLRVSWAALQYDAGEIYQASASVDGAASCQINEIKNYLAGSVVSGASSTQGSGSAEASSRIGVELLVSWTALEFAKGLDPLLGGETAGSSTASAEAGKQYFQQIEVLGQGEALSNFFRSKTTSAAVRGEGNVSITTFSNLLDYVENWACTIDQAGPTWGCETSQSVAVWSIVSGTSGTSPETWSSAIQESAPVWAASVSEQPVEWSRTARTG